MSIINRHIAKTISWRVVGTADTMLLSWLITGSVEAGLQIGFADVVIKMILYYAHERLWYKSSVTNATTRHIFKTITWRIIGTATTILLSFWIWGDSTQSFQIGGAETITKTILYFFHERMWYGLAYGLRTYRGLKKDA